MICIQRGRGRGAVLFWITNIVLSIVDKNQFRYSIFIEAQTIFWVAYNTYPLEPTLVSKRESTIGAVDAEK